MDQCSGKSKVRAKLQTNEKSNRKDDQVCAPFEQSHHAAEIAEPAELNDLARFEGEGGREPATPDWVDVPLENAIWRRPTGGKSK
jgi:hypothetical protein